MAWYDDLYGSVGPLGALSLGVGAVGTGMGIWDQYQANEAAQKREHLAEQMMRMGPGAYAPNYSPEQLQSMYFRPAASFMQSQGRTSGGDFTQGLADAALKAEGDRQALGNQIYSARLAALGYGPPPGPSGTTGALGQSLQSLMLMQALAGRNRQPEQPGQATTNWMGGYPYQPFYPQGAQQQEPMTGGWGSYMPTMYESTRTLPQETLPNYGAGGSFYGMSDQ
jgi:hypothetical protein